MLASIGFLAILAAGEGFFADFPPSFTADGWLAVLFIGVGSGIGYYLWLWALGHAPATRVAIFLSLSPVTAMVLGAVFLGERVTASSRSASSAYRGSAPRERKSPGYEGDAERDDAACSCGEAHGGRVGCTVQ